MQGGTSKMSSKQLYEVIKEIARATVNESKPVAFCFGTVESANPLKIRLSQKILLTNAFLVLSEACRDTTTTMTIDGATKNVKVLKRLKKGEKVLMIRFDSGQKYYVVERVD